MEAAGESGFAFFQRLIGSMAASSLVPRILALLKIPFGIVSMRNVPSGNISFVSRRYAMSRSRLSKLPSSISLMAPTGALMNPSGPSSGLTQNC